jgi:hypothetical protein
MLIEFQGMFCYVTQDIIQGFGKNRRGITLNLN